MANVSFLMPWVSVDEAAGQRIEKELRAEVAPGHPLFDVSTKVLARRVDIDHVLVGLQGGPVVVVHLTWSGRQEVPPWPDVDPSPTIEHWLRHDMLTDRAQWQAAEAENRGPNSESKA